LTPAAPLFALAGDPVPLGGGAEWFTGVRGARLRAALFPAAGGVRGSVVVSPGRTEPIEKYLEAARRLTAAGFAVLVHDWRGQGLSHRALADRLLGHADGYADFLTDFRTLLDAYEDRLPKPWLAVGHSMGGCLTLLALAEGERRFAGALLSAPMLGIQTGRVPRPAARALSRSMRWIGRGGLSVPAPAGPEPAPFAGNVLTHDPARYARNLALVEAFPDLALGPPTWGWLGFAFAATDRLARGAGTGRIEIPVVVLLAGEDRLVDNRAARAVAANLPKGEVVEIAGASHELLQETDALQAPVWAAFTALAAAVAP
jgi:lysophospholipase